MALPPGNPDTFVQEVDDAVRADRLQEFGRRFGTPLIALLVIGLLTFAGWLYWNTHRDSSAGALGTTLNGAIDSLAQGRPKAATSAAEPLAKGDNATYRALALMVQGNAALSQGDMQGASAKFATVAADAAVDQSLRDAALLRQMLADYDRIQPATLIARLRHIVAQPDSPAFASAAELTALAELKRGNDAAAGALFKRIADSDNAPESLKSRAVQMAGMLGVDAVPDADNRPAARAPARNEE